MSADKNVVCRLLPQVYMYCCNKTLVSLSPDHLTRERSVTPVILNFKKPKSGN